MANFPEIWPCTFLENGTKSMVPIDAAWDVLRSDIRSTESLRLIKLEVTRVSDSMEEKD